MNLRCSRRYDSGSESETAATLSCLARSGEVIMVALVGEVYMIREVALFYDVVFCFFMRAHRLFQS